MKHLKMLYFICKKKIIIICKFVKSITIYNHIVTKIKIKTTIIKVKIINHKSMSKILKYLLFLFFF